MKIAVYGSLAYDRILNFEGNFADHILPDKAHQINVSFFAPTLSESYGGTAGNIAYSLALLTAQPSIVARAGNDFAPYSEWLARHGVDTKLIEIDENARTAFATILTDEKDNQIAAFYPGAMEKPYAAPLPAPKDILLAIVAAGNPDDMRKLPGHFRTNGIPFIYDPAQQIPALSSEDLVSGMRGAEALIANDYELALIMKKTGLSEADILKETEMLVTTLGERGSRVAVQEETFEIPPAKPKSNEDPTGAGDAYRAGFIVGMLNGWPLSVVGRFAGVIACYAVEKKGTQAHTFTSDDVQSRYRENFGEGLPQI